MQPILLLCLTCWLASLSGTEGGPVTGAPVELAVADRVHAEVFKRFSPAVVGLSCQGSFQGQASGFYGTGAVISPTGLILTATTVVPKDGHAIKVYFTSGHVRPASVVAIRSDCEAVLLQLNEKLTDLPHMPLARSGDCAVGDPVYSWGNPHLTIQQDGNVSLSIGAISGIYATASVDDQSRYVGQVIEVDAALNPGSDGGPITDRQGNLIGVMSLAFSPTRWLGLAIPTDRIRAEMTDLQVVPPVPQVRSLPSERRTWATAFALQAAATKVAPAVVGIYTVRKGDKEAAPERRDTQTLAARAAYPRNQRSGWERLQGPVGAASGFLIDPTGIVITSAFNVSPALFPNTVRDQRGRLQQKMVERPVEALYVYLADGTRYAAEVLGTSTSYDLAVLRLKDTKNARFSAIDLAAGVPLKTGSAIAVLGRSEAGGSLQLNGGTVSAIDRVNGLAMQISALTNYGNQGGPVIDREGRLVGMASHLNIGTVWRQNCGVGFCLRATHLAAAVRLLLAGKQPKPVQRPGIGVHVDLDTEVGGALITEVIADGPAAQAGLQAGDIVLAVNGEAVTGYIALNNLILQADIGAKITLAVQRGDERLDCTVTVGAE